MRHRHYTEEDIRKRIRRADKRGATLDEICEIAAEFGAYIDCTKTLREAALDDQCFSHADEMVKRICADRDHRPFFIFGFLNEDGDIHEKPSAEVMYKYLCTIKEKQGMTCKEKQLRYEAEYLREIREFPEFSMYPERDDTDEWDYLDGCDDSDE